jgi:hypothetical protein
MVKGDEISRIFERKFADDKVFIDSQTYWCKTWAVLLYYNRGPLGVTDVILPQIPESVHS